MMSSFMNHKLLLLSLILAIAIPAAASYPGDEEPTDKSVWAKIDYASFDMESINGDVVKITIEAEGEASPNTHHWGIAFIVVYKDGSTDYNGVFIEGPLNITTEEILLFEPANDNNWSKWKFYNVAYVDREKIGLTKEDLENVSSFEVWVRAYRDAEGKLWNQSFLTVTQNVSSEIEEFYEENNDNHDVWFLAGFALAVVVIGGYAAYKWKKRN